MKEALAELGRLLPATARLVYRLVQDERVDGRARVVVVAALGYAILPFDIIPDRIPVIGKVDDVAIAAGALAALFDEAGEDILREHWDASPGSLESLVSMVDTVGRLLPRPARRLLRAGK